MNRSFKRKRFGDGIRKGQKHKHQPRRGSPGMLLTCETGREFKCKREGLEILRHYHHEKDNASSSCGTKVDAAKKTKATLSLEEEIAMLNSGASIENVLEQNETTPDSTFKKTSSSPFAVYETGCRGTVFVMCTLPNCSILPTTFGESHTRNDDSQKKNNETEETEQKVLTKKPRLENDKEGTDATITKHDNGTEPRADNAHVNHNDEKEKATGKPTWDPIATVMRVMADLDGKSSTRVAPSSRFVTRMIPMQVTCFASVDEIQSAARVLLHDKLFLSLPTTSQSTDKKPSPCTYAVKIKRRNCSNITRDQIFDTIGQIVLEHQHKKWKVDLKHPQYTIHVEICKTLCGMSVMANYESFRNFNLVQIRETSTSEKQ